MPSRRALALGLTLIAACALSACNRSSTDGLTRARAAVEAQDIASAMVQLKSHLQKKPNDAEARFLLGQLFAQGEEHTAAVAEFQKAMEAGYPAKQVAPAIARSLLRIGDTARVLSMFRNEKLDDPAATAELKASVGLALALRGDLDGAVNQIDAALALAPQSTPALLMRARLLAAQAKPDEGMRIVDELVGRDPKNPEVWTTKGDFILRTGGDPKQAAEAFGKALSVSPKDAYALGAMVTVSLAMGDIPAATTAMNQLRKVAPKHYNTARHDAALAYASGQHERAREIYQTILRGSPQNVQALVLAGENELHLGGLVQAEALFSKALALDPASTVARRLLARAQLQLGQAPKSLQTIAPLVDAPNAGPEVLALAAEARLLNGEPKAADALYTRMAKLKPSDPRLRTIIAAAGFGRSTDEAVLGELRSIATGDSGVSADMALIAALMRKGQTAEALTALDALERKRPGDPKNQLLRGQILIARNDAAGARQAFEAVLAKTPGYMPAVKALAALDLREGKGAAAEDRLKAIVKAQQTNSVALVTYADIKERLGADPKEVLKLREQAVKVAPRDEDAHMALVRHHFTAGNYDAALVAAQAATVAMPDNIDMLELLGECQIRKNQASQAIATFGKIIGLLPRSPRGYLLTAAVQMQQGDDEAARRSIDKVLQVSPANTEAQGYLVAMALRQKKFDAAIELARGYQKLRPDDGYGHTLEGEVEFARGKFDAAVAAFRKAVQKPNAGAAPRKLYAALVRSGKAAEADSFAASWQKSHPADADFVYFTGDVAMARGANADAAKRFEAALKINPEHVLALNNLAMLHLQSKQPDALALAERAARAAPNEPAVLDTLAIALLAANRVDDAVNAQLRAVSLAPDSPDLRLTLARALIQAREKARAKTELDRLAALGSGFAQQAEVSKLRAELGLN